MILRQTRKVFNLFKLSKTKMLSLVFILFSCIVTAQSNDYLADVLPDSTPIPFNIEMVPSGMLVHSGIFSPDLEEYYFTVSDKNFQRFDVKMSSKANGKWSTPVNAFFNTNYNEHGTSFSPDGRYLYFSSTRPVNISGVKNTWHIWRSEKINGVWSNPEYIDIPNLRDKLISHPSLTKDGTMYFHSGNTNYTNLNIYYSKQIGGIFQDAIKLPQEINIGTLQDTPFISPDESFILFESISTIYISLRDNSGKWSIAKALNEKINKNAKGNPFISPDNKYLFYAAGVEPSPDEKWSVFWVSTDAIFNTTTVEDQKEDVIEGFELSQNYPNPFNPATNIKYSVPKAGFVAIKIYDLLGKEIAEPVNEEKNSGNYQFIFDGRHLTTGIYIYKLTAGKFNQSRKMLLVK